VQIRTKSDADSRTFKAEKKRHSIHTPDRQLLFANGTENETVSWCTETQVREN